MPEQDDVVRTAKDSFTHLIGFYAKWVALPLIAIYLCTGFYSVEQNKIGVLQRFGKVIDDEVKPGMHYAFPWPIDRVEKVAVKEMKILAIDDFAKTFADTSPAAVFKNLTGLTPYCITGDNNIVNISLTIKYNITDPVAYLFNVRHSEALLRDVAATAILHGLTTLSVDEILTYGKERIASEIKLKLGEKLDAIAAGLSVSFIELKDVSPPEDVQSYFDDVINAKVDKSRMLEDAKSTANRRRSRAESDGYSLVQQAHTYQTEQVSHATGEARRFEEQLKEYKKSPGVSRTRIYLEFMRVIYPKLKHVIVVDSNARKKPFNVRIMAE